MLLTIPLLSGGGVFSWFGQGDGGVSFGQGGGGVSFGQGQRQLQLQPHRCFHLRWCQLRRNARQLRHGLLVGLLRVRTRQCNR